jgi:hypothetical protein
MDREILPAISSPFTYSLDFSPQGILSQVIVGVIFMADLKVFYQKARQNLNFLKEKAVKQSNDVSLSLFNEIRDHETAINLTERALQGELSNTE